MTNMKEPRPKHSSARRDHAAGGADAHAVEAATDTKGLLKATAITILVAAAVLVLFVLPAEYGIDVTGAGEALGLAAMAEPVAHEPVGGTSTAEIISVSETPKRSDELSVTLQPGEGAEVKLEMLAGDGVVFEWTTVGGPVNFDMHGEPTGGSSTSYWAGADTESSAGVLTAPIDGTHGWFWRNRGEVPVEITVRTSGFYERLFRAK